MNTPRMLKGTIIAITAAALLAAFIPSSAYAHDPGMPVPGMSRYGYLPGIPVPNLNDPRTANLVGSFLGAFLGTMIIDSTLDRHKIGDRDMEVLMAVAKLAAVMIGRAESAPVAATA